MQAKPHSTFSQSSGKISLNPMWNELLLSERPSCSNPWTQRPSNSGVYLKRHLKPWHQIKRHGMERTETEQLRERKTGVVISAFRNSFIASLYTHAQTQMSVKVDQATEMNVSSNESWNPVHTEKRPEGLRCVFQGITVLPDSSGLVSL